MTEGAKCRETHFAKVKRKTVGTFDPETKKLRRSKNLAPPNENFQTVPRVGRVAAMAPKRRGATVAKAKAGPHSLVTYAVSKGVALEHAKASLDAFAEQWAQMMDCTPRQALLNMNADGIGDEYVQYLVANASLREYRESQSQRSQEGNDGSGGGGDRERFDAPCPANDTSGGAQRRRSSADASGGGVCGVLP